MKRKTAAVLAGIVLAIYLQFPGAALQNTESVPPDHPSYTAEWVLPPDLNARAKGLCIIGHSHVNGLSINTISDIDYIACDGMTAIDARYSADFLLPDGSHGTIPEGLAQKEYGTVALMLGTNDMPYGRAMLKDYRSHMEYLLDQISWVLPEAKICLVSLAPVGRTYCSYMYSFDKTVIQDYNSELMKIAEERQIPFIDIFTPLADEEGFTARNYESTDGLHFTVQGYRVMLNEIVTALS